MRALIFSILLLCACARRMPTPHDGSCMGIAAAEFQDCAIAADDRHVVRLVFAGGNPIYQMQANQEHVLALQVCQWNREHAMQTCRLGWEMEKDQRSAPRHCTMDADCPGAELCERGVCRD